MGDNSIREIIIQGSQETDREAQAECTEDEVGRLVAKGQVTLHEIALMRGCPRSVTGRGGTIVGALTTGLQHAHRCHSQLQQEDPEDTPRTSPTPVQPTGKRKSLKASVGKLSRPRELRWKAQKKQRFNELRRAAEQAALHEETRQRTEEAKDERS